tara:strand:- start:502 stop:1440 length:939 start_codon:yes stop_codon:yes gene_type:complete
MERIFAIPINNKKELMENNINFDQLAKNAIEIFFVQVFEHNFFHADMHPGNIFIQEKNNNVQFVLVDFGIMGSLSAFDKKYLAENFVAFFNRDYARVARLHVECEWVPRDTNISQLEKAIRDNCESMLDKPIKDVSLSEIIIGLFDTARRFKLEVQPQLILMQKTLLYTEGLGREFSPELDLWKESKPILEGWMKKQKGITSVIRKLQKSAYEMVDIIPDLPSSIRRLTNIINNDQINLEKNIEKLRDIEMRILTNSIRNYYYMFISLFILIVFVNSYLFITGQHLDYYYYASAFILFIFYLYRPKRLIDGR